MVFSRFLSQFAKLAILLSLVVFLASCHSSDDDDDSIFQTSDPCGTVTDLTDDYVIASLGGDDCRHWDIVPGSTYDGFMDEYSITVSDGPAELLLKTGCFQARLYLLNTPSSCSSGCEFFNLKIMALAFNDLTHRLDYTAQINIDLIAGTYLVIVEGPPGGGVNDCGGYTVSHNIDWARLPPDN